MDILISPLNSNERISLIGSSFQKFKDNILSLGSCYRYDYLIKSCDTKRVVNPATGDIFHVRISFVNISMMVT